MHLSLSLLPKNSPLSNLLSELNRSLPYGICHAHLPQLWAITAETFIEPDDWFTSLIAHFLTPPSRHARVLKSCVIARSAEDGTRKSHRRRRAGPPCIEKFRNPFAGPPADALSSCRLYSNAAVAAGDGPAGTRTCCTHGPRALTAWPCGRLGVSDGRTTGATRTKRICIWRSRTRARHSARSARS